MKKNTSILILCCSFALVSFIELDKQEIIKLLQGYTELNKQHTDAYINKDQSRQREIDIKLDSVHENIFIPALTHIESFFCESKDKELIENYIAMIESINHSASEAPRWTFSKMFVCHPAIVMDAVSKSKNKTLVLKDLSFGFENIIHTIDTTELNVNELRKKIK